MFIKLCVAGMEALIQDGDQATLNSLAKPTHQNGRKHALGRRKTYCRGSERSSDDQQIILRVF
jgi:hypothetical protein